MDSERENRGAENVPGTPNQSGGSDDVSSTEPRHETPSTPSEAPSTPSETPDRTAPMSSSERPTEVAPAPRPDSTRPPQKAKRRYVPRLKTVIILLLLAIPLVVAAGLAKATYDYSDKYDGKILPGAKIAGVDVGGMKRGKALRAVRRALEPQLDRKVTVTWKDESWKVTPRELGAKSNARAAVEKALAESEDASMMDKAQMRWLGEDLDFREDVALKYPKKGASAFISGLAQEFNQQATDAAIDYSSGWVEFVKEKMGREINPKASTKELLSALRSGDRVARLDVDTFKPETTVEDFDQVLLVRHSDYKLYLYNDGKITHEWPVAIGTAEYPTPTGQWTVIDKVMGPSWTNPAPDGWGSDMPKYIPPGPSNPLGLAAVYWDASGIRFHGTSDLGSIGTPASHGCVRMYNEDVLELYDLVEIGSPIISI